MNSFGRSLIGSAFKSLGLSGSECVGGRWLGFMIVALALYGDMIKRILPPTAALSTLYGAACAILVGAVVSKRGTGWYRAPRISNLAGVLIAVSVAQLLTSFPEDMAAALIATAYLCIPLAYLVVLPGVCPDFDLRAFAFYATVLMVPIHIVGFIQQFIDPSFMISTAYSGELGGVIERNFLDEGTFNRYPSIFASADRYSGVAMMQILLTPLLLAIDRGPAPRTIAWAALSVVAGGVSLFIAGARSRVIIVAVALLGAGAVGLVTILRRDSAKRWAQLALLTFAVLCLGFTAVLSIDAAKDALVDEFPVLTMLDQSLEQGDIGDRVEEGIYVSQIPDEVTFFGRGPGTDAGGHPGEFGVRAMWIEGGLFWTSIALLIHAGILIGLGYAVWRIALSGNTLLVPLAIGQLLAWLFAVLAGLSSTFELSQALLLVPSIATMSCMTYKWRGAAASRACEREL